MLYLIGLGLSSEKDVTVQGLEIINRCERVYLESYTSILMVPKERLEEFYGRQILLSDRENVESSSDEIMRDADHVDVAFLVVGDPLGYRIVENGPAHTLCLLDIKVKEISEMNLARGRTIYEPPRYMTVAQASQQLLEAESIQQRKDTVAVGVARLGSNDQEIRCGTLHELCDYDFGSPLHSMVIVGARVHPMELEYLRAFAINQDTFETCCRSLQQSS